MDLLGSWKRSDYCGELTEKDVGKTVTVMGWVQKSRNLGSLIFVDVRDRSGIIQAVFNQDLDKEQFEKAFSLRSEFVVAINGVVADRGPEAVNAKMKTGKIEIISKELKILSKSETPPIYIEEGLDANEAVRLKYRYLDLRRPDIQRNIMLRHKAAKSARDFFDSNGFLEIETPMLTKSTPEGARDYLVPSRLFPGRFFALPQSPQIFKQLLMVSGYDRYMQIVKCFRDEDLRADRQPEFTQIDVEMSFVSVDDVLEINERFIKKLFKDILDIDIALPLPRMTYREAMDRFGSDKPDLRFGMELVELTEVVKGGCGFKVFDDAIASGGSVRAIVAEGCSNFSRKEIDALTERVKTYRAKGLAWAAVEDGGIRCPFSKFMEKPAFDRLIEASGAKPTDLILIVADSNTDTVLNALGQLRLEVGRKRGLINDDAGFKVLWVTEFPLLEYDEEEGRWVAKHHPFTSPMDEDLDMLDSDPAGARAKAYDMVINGMEVGGGSIRNSNQELQAKMFELLGFTKEDANERFGFLLEAFRFGTPPHGGIAYGLDRLVMILAGCDSIRDVIAFPKVQNSSCLMTGAPGEVDEGQLEMLKIIKKEQ
ncbi:MAG: aspartate--tRNA ligase [Oscillospiraceae bacterium]|nr:aspartate--tRNA ligase [Oscillospiraceae bacterium]